MSPVAHLPLTPHGTTLLVRVMLEGKPADLVLDTGAYTSLLTAKAVSRIGLIHMRGEEVVGGIGLTGGIGGNRSTLSVTARSVDIGGLRAKNYNFLSTDMDMAFADGLLSTDLLSLFDVDLDLPENQAILYRPSGDCSHPSAFLESPLFVVPLKPNGRDRRPRIPITIEGQDFIALVDTGASHSAIFRAAGARLGLRAADLHGDRAFTATGIGPKNVSGVQHVFHEVAIGDLVLPDMKMGLLDEAFEPDVDVLLGEDFIRQVHLWISYSSHTLIMQYPPRPSKKA